MRKYQGILFAALFCFAMLLLLAAGLWWYRPRRAEPVPGRVYESERMPENNAVLNPEPEVAEKQSGYCLCFTIWSLSAVRGDYNTVKKQRIKSAYGRYEANGQEGK